MIVQIMDNEFIYHYNKNYLYYYHLHNIHPVPELGYIVTTL